MRLVIIYKNLGVAGNEAITRPSPFPDFLHVIVAILQSDWSDLCFNRIGLTDTSI